MNFRNSLLALGVAVWLWVAPAVVKAQEDTFKDYLAVISKDSVNTYTVEPSRIIWDAECRMVKWWWRTYVVDWPIKEIWEIVNDNPEDPIEDSSLKYTKWDWSLEDCNELSSNECYLSEKEFDEMIKSLRNWKTCTKTRTGALNIAWV